MKQFEPGQKVWFVSDGAGWKIWRATCLGTDQKYDREWFRLDTQSGICLWPSELIYATKAEAIQAAMKARDATVERLNALTWEAGE